MPCVLRAKSEGRGKVQSAGKSANPLARGGAKNSGADAASAMGIGRTQINCVRSEKAAERQKQSSESQRQGG
jgi:hypothetical protein